MKCIQLGFRTETYQERVVTHCPVTTHLGLPCDPGLAYNTLSRSCEWPDTLLDAGCNPERECCMVIGYPECPLQ